MLQPALILFFNLKNLLARYKICTAWLIVVFLFLLAMSCNDKPHAKDVRGTAFSGSEACTPCHKEIAGNYSRTAHAITSRPGNVSNIAGTLDFPGNVLYFPDSQRVTVDRKGPVVFQTSWIGHSKMISKPIDIVMGSGGKGQTYLYYQHDSILQLPLSWFTSAHAWTNSPGYPADKIYFERVVRSGCFGCHASAANIKYDYTVYTEPEEKYLPNGLLLGIDCERCHGPSAAHVKYQLEHPGDSTPNDITVINSLAREQKTDMCGVCHSGFMNAGRSIFEFRPGSRLADFYLSVENIPENTELDVHGKQVPLLKQSKCYLASNTLTCITCHNPHTNQKNQLAAFSKRCLGCHSESTHNYCSLKETAGMDLTSNCIDCHMPEKASKTITLLTNNSKAPLPDIIRTHLIKVYKAESDSIIRLRRALSIQEKGGLAGPAYH